MTEEDKKKFGDDDFGRQMHANHMREKARNRVRSIKVMAARVVAAELAEGKEKLLGINALALSAVDRCTKAFDAIEAAYVAPKESNL